MNPILRSWAAHVPEVWFAIPGDPTTLTGGYVYARRLIDALPAAGWTPHLVSWPGSFPLPTAADLEAVEISLKQLPADATLLIDGLAFGALPTALLSRITQRIVALVHHPLALESGLAPETARDFAARERAALTHAHHVIVTSPMTARTLTQDYGVPAHKLHVALPGTTRAARTQGTPAIPRLLTVGTLTRRKGHDILVQALARLTDLSWQSVIVGSPDRDPAVAREIEALIAAHDLGARITLAGELSGAALTAAYDTADLFVLASRYEGYGMVFAEALAHGLPIVACAGGAITETVPQDAGLLTPPDDIDALSASLRRILSDTPLRQTMADAAWRHGQALPGWEDTARTVATALTTAMDTAA